VLVYNQSVRAIRALTSTVADVGATLAAGNQQRTDAAAVALETRLVAMLEEGPEKRRRVWDRLTRTQNLGTPSHGGVTNDGTAVSAARGGTRGLSAPIEILAGQPAGQMTAASRTPSTRGGHEAASSLVSLEPSRPPVSLGGRSRCLQATTRYVAGAAGLQRGGAGVAAAMYSMSR